MRRRVRFGRAEATTPGKHGIGDWRVSLGSTAPTHSELLFMLGMVLIAENRYNGPGQLGWIRLWHYVDLLQGVKTVERVLEVAEDCQNDIDSSPARVRRDVSA